MRAEQSRHIPTPPISLQTPTTTAAAADVDLPPPPPPEFHATSTRRGDGIYCTTKGETNTQISHITSRATHTSACSSRPRTFPYVAIHVNTNTKTHPRHRGRSKSVAFRACTQQGTWYTVVYFAVMQPNLGAPRKDHRILRYVCRSAKHHQNGCPCLERGAVQSAGCKHEPAGRRSASRLGATSG